MSTTRDNSQQQTNNIEVIPSDDKESIKRHEDYDLDQAINESKQLLIRNNNIGRFLKDQNWDQQPNKYPESSRNDQPMSHSADTNPRMMDTPLWDAASLEKADALREKNERQMYKMYLRLQEEIENTYVDDDTEEIVDEYFDEKEGDEDEVEE